jgi:hypothetical protein
MLIADYSGNDLGSDVMISLDKVTKPCYFCGKYGGRGIGYEKRRNGCFSLLFGEGVERGFLTACLTVDRDLQDEQDVVGFADGCYL